MRALAGELKPTDRAAYLKGRYELCRSRGICTTCQNRDAQPNRVQCFDCASSQRKPGATPAPDDPVPTFVFGEGLEEGHPNRGIQFNPRSWDWRIGGVPTVNAAAS